MFTIGYDYHMRSRALQQLIDDVKLRRAQRREAVYSKPERELAKPEGWWTAHRMQDLADEALVEHLEDLWSFPGMKRPATTARLRDKQFVKCAERLRPLLADLMWQASQQGDTHLAAVYDQTIVFILRHTNQLRWQNGMPYDVSYFVPDEAAHEPHEQESEHASLSIMAPPQASEVFDVEALDDFQPTGA